MTDLIEANQSGSRRLEFLAMSLAALVAIGALARRDPALLTCQSVQPPKVAPMEFKKEPKVDPILKDMLFHD